MKNNWAIIIFLIILSLILGVFLSRFLEGYIERKYPYYLPLEECFVYASQFDTRTEKLWEICQCENRDNHWDCNMNGCEYGIGRCMIIPSTGKKCEEELGRELDLLDEQDNWDCAWHLLTTEGTQHWGTPDTDWGTYHCWAG